MIEPAVIAQVSALGIRMKGEQVALDHDYTRHTLLHHGSESERNRGQVPITEDDLALAAMILNQSQGCRQNLKTGLCAWRLLRVWALTGTRLFMKCAAPGRLCSRCSNAPNKTAALLDVPHY
ncbi:MAG: hypothetical protein WAW42_06030 [Candidatus Competibacteraceae bacterium]